MELKSLQGVGAAGDRDRVGRSAEGGELGLERLDLVTQDVSAALEHPTDGRIDGRAVREVAGSGIGLGDGRGDGLGHGLVS